MITTYIFFNFRKVKNIDIKITLSLSTKTLVQSEYFVAQYPAYKVKDFLATYFGEVQFSKYRTLRTVKQIPFKYLTLYAVNIFTLQV